LATVGFHFFLCQLQRTGSFMYFNVHMLCTENLFDGPVYPGLQ